MWGQSEQMYIHLSYILFYISITPPLVIIKTSEHFLQVAEWGPRLTLLGRLSFNSQKYLKQSFQFWGQLVIFCDKLVRWIVGICIISCSQKQKAKKKAKHSLSESREELRYSLTLILD